MLYYILFRNRPVSRNPVGRATGFPASGPCRRRRFRASSPVLLQRTRSRNTRHCRRNTSGRGEGSTPHRPDKPPSACTHICCPYTSCTVYKVNDRRINIVYNYNTIYFVSRLGYKTNKYRCTYIIFIFHISILSAG